MGTETLMLAAVCGVGALLTLALVPIMRSLALALRIVDEPDFRKIHDYPVPYLGGLAMYLSVTFGCAWIASLFPQLYEERVLYLIAACTVIVLVGVVDDIAGLSAWAKLPFEIAAGCMVFAAGIRVEALASPLNDAVIPVPWATSLVITVSWIVAISNAINLLDGLDGLAAGVVIIASAANLVTALVLGNMAAVFLYALIIGVCLGFLRFNWHPAKIFMGDAGSLLLGFLLATAAILGESKRTMVFALLPVGLPLLDVLLAVVRRARRGQHIFRADRDHLHHRLLRIGLSHRSVVFVYWVVSLYLGLSAVVLLQLRREYALVMFVLYGMGLFMAWSILRFIENRIHAVLQSAAAAPVLRDAQPGSPEQSGESHAPD